MNRIDLITTTPLLEGWKIEQYLGIVTYQIVIGTNLFRDFFASFRDIFGGAALGYQKELQKMESIAIKNLQEKASKLGANCIVGVRLDYDDVSGKQKSMFMLTISGTAVKANPLNSMAKQNSIDSKEEVILEEMLYEVEKQKFINIITRDDKIRIITDDIPNLIRFNIKATIEVLVLLQKYFENEKLKEYALRYFELLKENEIEILLLSNIIGNCRLETLKLLKKAIRENAAFNLETLAKMLMHENPRIVRVGLYFADLDIATYSRNDIMKLEKIKILVGKAINRFPILHKKEKVFGKDKEYWICFECGDENSRSKLRCAKYECNTSYLGLPKDYNADSLIELLDIKINFLKDRFT